MLCLVYGSVADVTADKGSSLALLSAEMFLHCRTSLDRLSAQDVGPERWGCPICAAPARRMRGCAASQWATISAGSGHAPTPKVPRHGSPSRHHRRLLGAARDRRRPGSPVVVAVTGGRGRRTRPRRAQRDASRGGDPGSRLRHAGQPADGGGVIDHCAGLNSDGRRRSRGWLSGLALPCESG